MHLFDKCCVPFSFFGPHPQFFNTQACCPPIQTCCPPAHAPFPNMYPSYPSYRAQQRPQCPPVQQAPVHQQPPVQPPLINNPPSSRSKG